MPELELRIHVEIYQPGQGGRLNISEEIKLAPLNFLELCQILGKFHELAETFKKVDVLKRK